jgi:hypothetical protein
MVPRPRSGRHASTTAVRSNGDAPRERTSRCSSCSAALGGERPFAARHQSGGVAPRAINSLLTIEPSCSTQSRRSWPTRDRPSRKYGNTAAAECFFPASALPMSGREGGHAISRITNASRSSKAPTLCAANRVFPRRMFVPPRAVFRDGRGAEPYSGSPAWRSASANIAGRALLEDKIAS